MKPKFSKELTLHRLEQAKDDLKAANMLFEGELYKPANNRAYYSIFHSIRCVLSIEPIDFKRHKASQIREDSDYDDKFIADKLQTELQIQTATELLQLVENYINEKLN